MKRRFLENQMNMTALSLSLKFLGGKQKTKYVVVTKKSIEKRRQLFNLKNFNNPKTLTLWGADGVMGAEGDAA
jgi:hypothetical protein